MSRYREKYRNEVVPALMKEFNYKNVMQVPQIEKIVLNIGIGEGTENAKVVDAATKQLTLIAGQKATVRKARKSISNFKLREGMPIGTAVTLRRDKMYDFLDRFINIAIPEIRDFRGVSGDAFDGHGNYTMGIQEQIIFPEIDYDMVDKIRGMNITIVTTAKSDEEGKALLAHFGFPFKRS